MTLNDTHDPTLRSWVASANGPGAEFPIQNLPFGVVRGRAGEAAQRIGVAIGDQVLDLVRCRDAGLFARLPSDVQAAVAAPVLNPLMALRSAARAELRHTVSQILRAGGSGTSRQLLVPTADLELVLPVAIGDYTDFYASIFHATNVGRLFRPDNPLLPNYKHVPLAYHGHSSSVVVSGTPVRRPSGQTKAAEAPAPTFGPSQRLDYEMEVGAFVGLGNGLGHPIPLDEAEHHLFGLCLLNDWSARDLQAWEYQPLGPFLAKNFATTISPWVVTLEALAPFRTPAASRPSEDPRPLPYLLSEKNEAAGGFDVTVDVFLRSAGMRRAGLTAMRLSRGSFRDMYWTVAQMIAHHTSNGCSLRSGDLVGSGTVSGPADDSLGSLLELTRQGTRPLMLPTGEQRTFLADGDEVILRGSCEREGYVTIGFGECSGVIAPAVPL